MWARIGMGAALASLIVAAAAAQPRPIRPPSPDPLVGVTDADPLELARVAARIGDPAVLARLDSQLNGALDRSLRARATEVARLAASTPQLLTEPGTLEGRLGGSPLLVQVIDPRGRIVARSSGCRISTEGFAIAVVSTSRQSRNAEAATCRRQPGAFGARDLSSATLVKRTANVLRCSCTHT